MYVRTFYPPEWPHFDHGVYPWDRPPNGGGHRRRDGTRHFMVSPDGRAEELDDAERASGRLAQLEIEAL